MKPAEGFHEGMSEEAFRSACAQRCAAHPDLPALKTIAAVGAYHADFGAADVDSDRLTKGLIYMAQSGILIAPDFGVDTVNFLNERNFLSEDKPADLVFISYIIAQKPFARQFVGLQYEQHKMSRVRAELAHAADPANFLDSKLGGVLCNNHSKESWLARVARGGAKMIYTHGGEGEIGSQTFAHDYAELIATPKLNKFWEGQWEKKLSEETRTVEQVHGRNLDIPLPWSAFFAEKSYLNAIKPALDAATTDLAKRARDILAPKPAFSVDKALSHSL